MKLKSDTIERIYYSTSQVAVELNESTFTVRFWCVAFGLNPMRRSGQRRFHKTDVEKLAQIKKLLHEDRYTVEGAKKKLQAGLA